MKLDDYLAERDESQSAFARRAGLPQQTVHAICNGAEPRASTARKIIIATGGLVSLDDLQPKAASLKAAAS